MSKYVDIAAITQIIGCVFNDSSILDNTDSYTIVEEDFPEQFHKIIFGAMYNLHQNNSKVNMDAIIDYLDKRPKYNSIFTSCHGTDYLIEVSKIAQPDSFNYYYTRLKKFSLLRAYDNFGLDVSFLYDPDNILDTQKKERQENWLDNTPLTEIADEIDKKLADIRYHYVEDDLGAGFQAGDGILELIESFKKAPEVGIPLYGNLINSVTMGARLRKFYLRSSATGVGKTRSMIADACNFACAKIYDERLGWIKNGTAQPTLFIATEQDKSEVQSMMLAFLSNVNENHIITGRYEEGEEERVITAAKVLQESPLYVEELPNFSMRDIESKIKKYIREKNVLYVCYDYLHSSLKILEEVSKSTNGIRLREDNILFMISARLKDIANLYGVFILSSTQLNGDYKTSETPDQNLLRGAKSIADKTDIGLVMLGVSEDDLKKLEPILQTSAFPTPNIKMSVYKNRRGPLTAVYLWGVSDLGTCRTQWYFATKWNHELVTVKDLRIIAEEEKGAF